MSYTGWLSPNGELIKCDGYAHLDKARNIAKAFNLYNENRQSDDVLREHGWVRISRLTYSDVGLAFWMPKSISESQRVFLYEIYNNAYEDLSKQGKETLTEWDII